MRRVVVTGLGLVTPLACGVEETWKRLLAGESGAGPITRFDASRVVTTYACEVPLGDGSNGTFNADDWMEPKERRKVDDFILYGIAAATQAVRDAGWEPEDEEERLRTGVMIGSGIGGGLGKLSRSTSSKLASSLMSSGISPAATRCMKGFCTGAVTPAGESRTMRRTDAGYVAA